MFLERQAETVRWSRQVSASAMQMPKAAGLLLECTPFSRTGGWVGLGTLGDELPRGEHAQA